MKHNVIYVSVRNYNPFLIKNLIVGYFLIVFWHVAQDKMWYDSSPVKDSRYARRLILDLERDATTYEDNNRTAVERNDAGLKASSNTARENLERQFNTLLGMRDDLPEFHRQRIDDALGHATETFENCPVFPHPLLDNTDALDNFIGRMRAGNNAPLAPNPSVRARPLHQSQSTCNLRPTAQVRHTQLSRSLTPNPNPAPAFPIPAAAGTAAGAAEPKTAVSRSNSRDDIQTSLHLPSSSSMFRPVASSSTLRVDRVPSSSLVPLVAAVGNASLTPPSNRMTARSYANSVDPLCASSPSVADLRQQQRDYIDKRCKEIEAEGEKKVAMAIERIYNEIRSQTNDRIQRLEAIIESRDEVLNENDAALIESLDRDACVSQNADALIRLIRLSKTC